MLYYLGTITAGAVAGLGFALIWRKLVPMRVHGEFWSEMTVLTRDIVTVDDTAVFLRLYKRLALAAGGYTLRNMVGVVVSCVPLIVILLAVGIPLFDGWDARAERLAVIPPGSATLESSGSPGVSTVKLIDENESIVLEGPVPKAGACWSTLRCATLGLLGFQVIQLSPPADKDLQPFIIRADHDDWNPLWPYLGSLEFMFYVAVMVVVSLVLLWRKPA